jgi:arylsulfatase A-like enzyme
MKYIYDARQGEEELYDLGTDRDEQHNNAAREPERAKRLRQRLAAWLQVEQRDAQARRAANSAMCSLDAVDLADVA